MGMGMSLVMRLRQTFTCRVCRQEPDQDARQAAAVVAALFGAARYALCICCKFEVRDHGDRNYRARWRRWALRGRASMTGGDKETSDAGSSDSLNGEVSR